MQTTQSSSHTGPQLLAARSVINESDTARRVAQRRYISPVQLRQIEAWQQQQRAVESQEFEDAFDDLGQQLEYAKRQSRLQDQRCEHSSSPHARRAVESGWRDHASMDASSFCSPKRYAARLSIASSAHSGSLTSASDSERVQIDQLSIDSGPQDLRQRLHLTKRKRASRNLRRDEMTCVAQSALGAEPSSAVRDDIWEGLEVGDELCFASRFSGISQLESKPKPDTQSGFCELDTQRTLRIVSSPSRHNIRDETLRPHALRGSATIRHTRAKTTADHSLYENLPTVSNLKERTAPEKERLLRRYADEQPEEHKHATLRNPAATRPKPQTGVHRKDRPRGLPSLISNFNITNSARKINDMAYDPIEQKWVGNEVDACVFDEQSSRRRRLGAIVPESITSHNMLFDNKAMRWVCAPGTKIEPDPFQEADADDSPNVRSDRQRATGVSGEQSTSSKATSGTMAITDCFALGEEFDVGPAFVRRQREAHHTWASRIRGWIVARDETVRRADLWQLFRLLHE
ncbi:hypothetical protein PYCC9005_002623 [Savitreella phatthalungensis]